MGYPQPDANQYCLAGYQYFRLNTLLASPGDIYESEQSGHGMAIGPQSDVANVALAYFDDQVPNFVQQTIISPNRAFVGRIDARNDSKYAPAQRPGRILFWPDDIFDENYRPQGFDPDADTIQFVTPRLDVIEYFKPQQSLGPARDDKEYVFQNYAVGRTWIVIPYYGRRYCFVQMTNQSLGGTTIEIRGVNYAITQNDSPNPYHQEHILLGSTTMAAPGDQQLSIFTAAKDGLFDGLVFSVLTEGPAPLRIITSDANSLTSGGTTGGGGT